MPSSMPNVRVVVRLPYNRPEQPLADPVRVEWNDEKAEILWKVIERSRAIDSGGADWKGLAAHLQVPLPYLLYRVHARYEEDLRGLKDIQGALSPSATHNAEEFPLIESSPVTGKPLNRLAGSSRLSNSGRTSLGIRARLNSLGANSPRKAASSSTLTLQTPKRPSALLKSVSTGSDYENEDTDSEEEEMLKEEEAERNAEEQEALDRKIQDLQRMMTNETLGLVSLGRRRSKGKGVDRGRLGMTSPPNSMQSSFRRDRLSSRSTSQSISSASSPQGSVPEIPSPPTDSMPHSPIRRRMSMSPKSSSPPVLSSRNAVGQPHRKYVHLHGSNHDSEASASSFSDFSDASLSASALESALASNINRNGSQTNLFTRSSAFARNRLGSVRNNGQ